MIRVPLRERDFFVHTRQFRHYETGEDHGDSNAGHQCNVKSHEIAL